MKQLLFLLTLPFLLLHTGTGKKPKNHSVYTGVGLGI